MKNKLLAGLFASTILAGCIPVVPAQSLPFSFYRADNAREISKVHCKTTEMRASWDHPVTNIEDSVFETRAHKIAEGYEVAETCLSITNTVNGKPFENPALPLVLGQTSIATISTNASLLSLSLTENLAESAERVLPPEMVTAFNKRFDPKVNTEEERLRWLQTYGVLAGKSLLIGDTFITNFSSSVSGDAQAVYWWAFKTNYNGLLVASIRYFMSSDTNDVQAALSRGVTQAPMGWFFELPVKKFPNTRTVGERMVFPHNLLLLRDINIAQTRRPGQKATSETTIDFENEITQKYNSP
jgi:hypothetical protein